MYSKCLEHKALEVYTPPRGNVMGHVASNLGYNYPPTKEELAIFDSPRQAHSEGGHGHGDGVPGNHHNINVPQVWPSDLSQPQQWDMFMANMDQLFSAR
ncbi:hypothetical protein D9758_015623 [Tetrapyrgos nigripes]|uniref:Uncharacterized protein n=1 Tax=Tetrapyrgos nigripes TaxID=182062 RepID=A0A8H5CMK0_9AGAR|nr:hypothetical protein D9758_015623 [Tetrapyrgos nigripes]